MLEIKAQCEFCTERLDDLWESQMPTSPEEWGRVYTTLVGYLFDAAWVWNDLGQMACPNHAGQLLGQGKGRGH